MLRGTIQLDISTATEEAPVKSELLDIGGYFIFQDCDGFFRTATEEAPVKSELLDIGGYQWQLVCPSRTSPDRFEIVCNQNVDGELWLCKAKYSAETKQGESDWKKLTEFRRYWFNSYDNDAPYFKGNGLGTGTPNSIKVDIEVKWSAPQTNLHPFDAALNMVFGGTSAELVPINKFVLAGNSNYFRNFFFGEMAAVSTGNDVNGNPIYDIQEDPDFNSRQFRFMVHAFLCMGSKLDCIKWISNEKENKIALLKLAVKYQLKMFEDFAEKELIKLGPGTMELLELADRRYDNCGRAIADATIADDDCGRQLRTRQLRTTIADDNCGLNNCGSTIADDNCGLFF